MLLFLNSFGIFSLFWILWAFGFFRISFPLGSPKRKNFWNIEGFPPRALLILLFSLSLRLLTFGIEPIYDDDWARFLWEGRTFQELGTPYTTRPIDWFGSDLGEREEEILSFINHPDYPTIYFPVLQFFFLLAYKIAGLKLWGLRFLYLIFDFGILFFLLRFCNSQDSKTSVGFLWGVSPLWIWEFYIHLHPDLIGIFFLLSGYFFFRRGTCLFAGIFWGLSFGTKPILPICLFLIFLWDFIKRGKKSKSLNRILLSSFVSFFVFFSFWIPYWQDGWDINGFFRFLSEFEFNSSIFALIQLWFPGSPRLWSSILWILFAGISLFLFSKETSFLASGIASLFLFSPLANPWYLLWCYPFLYLFASSNKGNSSLQVLWVVVWSLTIFLSYATGKNLGRVELGTYEHPHWVRFLEFFPVFLAFSIGVSFHAFQKKSDSFNE